MGDENVQKLDSGDGCTTVNVLKTTELYTLKWRILCYVNYILIKPLLKNTVKKKVIIERKKTNSCTETHGPLAKIMEEESE